MSDYDNWVAAGRPAEWPPKKSKNIIRPTAVLPKSKSVVTPMVTPTSTGGASEAVVPANQQDKPGPTYHGNKWGTVFEAVTDQLMRGKEATSSGVGAILEGKNPVEIGKAMSEGFNLKQTKGRKSWRDVILMTPGGKKFDKKTLAAATFAADMLLDPLNYVGIGEVMWLVKLAGKASGAVKLVNAARKVAQGVATSEKALNAISMISSKTALRLRNAEQAEKAIALERSIGASRSAALEAGKNIVREIPKEETRRAITGQVARSGVNFEDPAAKALNLTEGQKGIISEAVDSRRAQDDLRKLKAEEWDTGVVREQRLPDEAIDIGGQPRKIGPGEADVTVKVPSENIPMNADDLLKREQAVARNARISENAKKLKPDAKLPESAIVEKPLTAAENVAKNEDFAIKFTADSANAAKELLLHDYIEDIARNPNITKGFTEVYNNRGKLDKMYVTLATGDPVIDAMFKGKQVDKYVAAHVKSLIKKFDDPGTKVFLDTLGRALNSWKAQQLLGTDFHMRNLVGNIWNSFLNLDMGRNPALWPKKAFDFLNSYALSYRILKNADNPAALREIVSNGRTGEEILAGFRGTDSLSHGMAAADIATDTVREALLGGKGIGKLNIFAFNKRLGTAIENNSRLAHGIQELLRGKSFTEAADSIEKFLFNYADLSELEKTVMKNLFPFWTWMRKNMPLQLEMLLRKPHKFATLRKMQGAVEMQGPGQEEAYRWMPETYKEANSVVIDKMKGKYLAMPQENYNPAMDVNRLGHPAATLIGMANPYIKVPVEWFFNQSAYSGKPIDPIRQGQPFGKEKDYYGLPGHRIGVPKLGVGQLLNQVKLIKATNDVMKSIVIKGSVKDTMMDPLNQMIILSSFAGAKLIPYSSASEMKKVANTAKRDKAELMSRAKALQQMAQASGKPGDKEKARLMIPEIRKQIKLVAQRLVDRFVRRKR